MASLQNTKRRIKSVDATKKITKAMELVSSAKLKKAKDKFELQRKVTEFVRKDLARGAYEIARESSLDKYIKYNESGKTLYIVIGSDMGLCGGYNSNVAKLAFNDSNMGDLFILVGKKTTGYLKSKGANIINTYLHYNDLDFYDTYYIVKEAIDLLESGQVTKIRLVSTSFVNSVTFDAKIQSLIPIINPFDDLNNPLDNPSEAEDLMKYILRDYLNSYIYTSINESRVCEYASSRMAMENATDNAIELKDQLLLQYNRVRQANITQEIAEIVAGSDAL